jgi:hypothetical protein
VLTTVLDIAGAALIVASVAIVFWPAALAVAGLFCLVASWRFDQ